MPAEFIAGTLAAFNDGEISAGEACERLGVGRSRIYTLRHEWLRGGRQLEMPGSGGNQRADYPEEVRAFIVRYLETCRPPNFAQLSEELERRLGFKRSRSSLSAYAGKHWPSLCAGKGHSAKPRRRWQRTRAGELLQHDTSPHIWWEGCAHEPLALTIDDATRLVCGATFIGAETTWAHFEHTRRLIEHHGLPGCVYTDGLSVFGNRAPAADGTDLCSQYQRALTGLGVAHLVARDAQAKGKVERRFTYWQNRLTRLFALEGVTSREQAAALLDEQVRWHNEKSVCRTLGLTPCDAAEKAHAQGRWGWRPAPDPRILDLQFSLRHKRRVAADNTIEFLGRAWQITATARKSVCVIHHPDRRFWVVDRTPELKEPKWPEILASYSL